MLKDDFCINLSRYPMCCDFVSYVQLIASYLIYPPAYPLVCILWPPKDLG